MKKVTTTFLALVTIAASFATNTKPATNTVATTTSANTVAVSFTAANNTTIEIERSFYSNNFVSIATVNSVFGGNLQITDNSAELTGRKAAYYRVKTIDANGVVNYSNVSVINLTGTTGTIAVKNIIHFAASQNGNAVITIKNAAGKTIAVKNAIVSNGNNSMEVANDLAKGIYTATVSINGVVEATEKLIAE